MRAACRGLDFYLGRMCGRSGRSWLWDAADGGRSKRCVVKRLRGCWRIAEAVKGTIRVLRLVQGFGTWTLDPGLWQSLKTRGRAPKLQEQTPKDGIGIIMPNSKQIISSAQLRPVCFFTMAPVRSRQTTSEKPSITPCDH